MSIPAAPGALLASGAAGFALGAGVASAVFGVLDAHHRHLRRLVLGFAARSLQDALAALLEDNGLPHRLAQPVANARDLAAAVARVAGE